MGISLSGNSKILICIYFVVKFENNYFNFRIDIVTCYPKTFVCLFVILYFNYKLVMFKLAKIV